VQAVIGYADSVTKEPHSIDVTDLPELLRVAEDVEATREVCVLRRGRENLALVIPIARRNGKTKRSRTQADVEAFRAAAGSWNDVDIEKLVEGIYASRRSSRPPVDL
jgi:hypothetical protein